MIRKPTITVTIADSVMLLYDVFDIVTKQGIKFDKNTVTVYDAVNQQTIFSQIDDVTNQIDHKRYEEYLIWFIDTFIVKPINSGRAEMLQQMVDQINQQNRAKLYKFMKY